MKTLFYYISYIEKSHWTGEGIYPDVEMKRVNSFEEAKEVIAERNVDLLRNNIDEQSIEVQPAIITNDMRLLLVYRAAYNEIEFKTWCGFVVDEQERINSSRYPTSGLPKADGEEVFGHFTDIVSKNCSEVKRQKLYFEVYDDYTGDYLGKDIKDKGWKVYPTIDEDKVLISEIELRNKWWSNLDLSWKTLFKKIIGEGFYSGIPTENSLNEIFELEKLNIRDAFMEPDSYLFIKNYIPLDLTPLKALTNLKVLKVDSFKVRNANSLSSLVNLEELNISSNELSSISFLKNLKNLKKLDISNNKLESLHGLESLTELKFLNCSSNELKNLWPLHELKELKTLICPYNKLTSLIPLPNLEYFEAGNNELPKEEIDNYLKTTKLFSKINRHNFRNQHTT
ncbi:leucine-rich repeat domain-containing protein [Salinimicrobium xinjiangense]|uniref:leucine-rich repeat domain-containing protein n=1 Tax=Salinimicrobium xinjiangense TaxID=438596 RepID=UPI0003F5E377|nr:leucine-rich repeat domain-containing protein [Salinimicrobium xinjiangense]